MTIHAAKGLEFPVVFIAGAEEGIMPHTRSMEEGGDDQSGPLEEERRLFYVAITRAREKLYITSCKRRRRLRDIVECAPSPFLAEIPPHLIETREAAGTAGEFTDDDAAAFFARMRETFK
jgi:DNA helicase-2/ATP-dependent DNA helicase PcrA